MIIIVDSHRSDATRVRAFIECGFKIFITLPSLVKLLPVVVAVVAGERLYAKRSSRREDHNSSASVCVCVCAVYLYAKLTLLLVTRLPQTHTHTHTFIGA